MTGLVIALIAFVGIPALSLRAGVASHPRSDWREFYRPERDPRS
jgi:hypothetical protein